MWSSKPMTPLPKGAAATSLTKLTPPAINSAMALAASSSPRPTYTTSSTMVKARAIKVRAGPRRACRSATVARIYHARRARDARRARRMEDPGQPLDAVDQARAGTAEAAVGVDRMDAPLADRPEPFPPWEMSGRGHLRRGACGVVAAGHGDHDVRIE